MGPTNQAIVRPGRTKTDEVTARCAVQGKLERPHDRADVGPPASSMSRQSNDRSASAGWRRTPDGRADPRQPSRPTGLESTQSKTQSAPNDALSCPRRPSDTNQAGGGQKTLLPFMRPHASQAVRQFKSSFSSNRLDSVISRGKH